MSTTTTSDDPTILAARREMQQWRILALEPSAMRSPDSVTGSARIDPNGAHLAAALYRLANHSSEDVYAMVATAAAGLVDIRDVSVDVDTRRELLTLSATLGEGPELPARSLSDGTLRFLALCIISLDPEAAGLLCMEEPENGIHPGKIKAMVNLVRNLAVDPTEPPGAENPLRQVIVNTHSPFYVEFQDADDLLLAKPAVTRRQGRQATTVRLLPLPGTWRAREGTTTVSRETFAEYLMLPPDAPLKLDLKIAG